MLDNLNTTVVVGMELDDLDPETAEMARKKRKTFDLPTNAVKVDPLR